MKWYVPSWNGDMRLAPHSDKDKTMLVIEQPTAAEQQVINEIAAECLKRGWLDKWERFPLATDAYRDQNKWEFVIAAPLEDVGPMASKIMRPGKAVLTAVRLANGQVVTCHESEAKLVELAKELQDQGEMEPDKKPEAAATVKRPTPCCPRCIPGSIGPASEVLLSFLDEEQHEQWALDRTLVVEGGLSGNRYRLAHRNSETARRVGRVCYDLDDRLVVHFHDWSVPPEEEILAAMLILRHKEPWLRNEATLFHAPIGTLRFKNPFGDVTDGARDAIFVEKLGIQIARAMGRRL